MCQFLIGNVRQKNEQECQLDKFQLYMCQFLIGNVRRVL